MLNVIGVIFLQEACWKSAVLKLLTVYVNHVQAVSILRHGIIKHPAFHVLSVEKVGNDSLTVQHWLNIYDFILTLSPLASIREQQISNNLWPSDLTEFWIVAWTCLNVIHFQPHFPLYVIFNILHPFRWRLAIFAEMHYQHQVQVCVPAWNVLCQGI